MKYYHNIFFIILLSSFSCAMDLAKKNQPVPRQVTFEEFKKGVVKDLNELAEETERCLSGMYEEVTMLARCLQSHRLYTIHYSAVSVPGQEQ